MFYLEKMIESDELFKAKAQNMGLNPTCLKEEEEEELIDTI